MNATLRYAELLTRLQGNAVANQPVVIGIGGFGGSGKSTFAARLSADLDDADALRCASGGVISPRGRSGWTRWGSQVHR